MHGCLTHLFRCEAKRYFSATQSFLIFSLNVYLSEIIKLSTGVRQHFIIFNAFLLTIWFGEAELYEHIKERMGWEAGSERFSKRIQLLL